MAILIDVRENSEYNSGHHPKAINIPLSALQHNKVPDIDTKEHIYLYCRSGNRSQVALQILQQKGFENVTNIGGLAEISSLEI